MKTGGSVLLTLGLGISIVAGYAALASSHGKSTFADHAGTLPPLIAEAERNYAGKQIALEKSLNLSRFEDPSSDPELRRAAMSRWMDQHRTELVKQGEDSEAIDRMYNQHGITAPSLEQRLEAAAAKHTADSRDPEGRLFREMLHLRAQFQKDPEALRQNMRQWQERNADTLQQAANEIQLKATATARRSSVPLPAPPSQPSIRPGDSENLRHLLAIRHERDLRLAALPRPAVSATGQSPSEADMESWRERAAAITESFNKALQPLETAVSQESAAKVRQMILSEISKE